MAIKNYIQLIDIKKVYDDGYIAVQDINIAINKGEFVTLLGPSGCGKTTILKMLAGFDMPTNGRILVDNVDIKELPINQRPTATVFQDYALFPNMSVKQNIAYGLKVMRKQLKDVSPKVKEKSEDAYRIAVKKAALEMKKNEIQQGKILRKLVKLDEQYRAYQEVENIKNMRHAQFNMKRDYFLRKLREHTTFDAELRLSRINRRREFRHIFNQKFSKHKELIDYDFTGLNK
jgi:spermidine/putrescine transport system ATP-binding protein